MTPVLAFDIETIPDCAGIRSLYNLPADLPDADVAELAFQKRRVSSGSDFLPPHLQRIVVIGCVLREGDNVQVFSIAEPERDEPAIVQKFFDVDLMDVLAMYQPRNNVPLDEMARLAGFPGKLGMAGAAVWEHYRKGEIRRIRDYCETDCANTYLLYLRFQLQRGALTKEHYLRECNLLKAYLEEQNLPHWREFLSLWKT